MYDGGMRTTPSSSRPRVLIIGAGFGGLEAAKAATRVQAQRQEPENEKYFMRGWLIRLGFGGKEAKGMRELFLKHLKGNSAFLTEADADKHRANEMRNRIFFISDIFYGFPPLLSGRTGGETSFLHSFRNFDT